MVLGLLFTGAWINRRFEGRPILVSYFGTWQHSAALRASRRTNASCAYAFGRVTQCR